jgi:hypothetical protein
VQKSHPAADRKTLREDAHVFVKVTPYPSAMSKLSAHLVSPDCCPIIQRHQNLWRRPCGVSRLAQQDGQTDQLDGGVCYSPTCFLILTIFDSTILFAYAEWSRIHTIWSAWSARGQTWGQSFKKSERSSSCESEACCVI